MIAVGVGEKSIAEQALELSYETPAIFSDNMKAPFRDIGMGEHTDEELGDIFENKHVLDIGSGAEGIARRLFKIFGDSKLAPQVVNLNPQLDGSLKEKRVIDAIKLDMQLSGEDTAAYMNHRNCMAGVVQDLPFEDEVFDIQISTWGFPKCMFDCWDDYYVHGLDEKVHAQHGYQEIIRTQAVGGLALLAPVAVRGEVSIVRSHLEDLPQSSRFTYSFSPGDKHGAVLQMNVSS